MKVIAITGSKGKTTILHVLNEVLMGLKNNVLTIGTERLKYNNVKVEEVDGKALVDTTKNPVDYIVIEAISNQLKTTPIPCDIAVFTNIEKNEHGDIHETFQDYLNCKKRLFDEMKPDGIAIVNIDCEYTKEIIKDCKAKIITYGKNGDYRPELNKMGTDWMSFFINGELFGTKLVGEYNMYNLTAAYLVLQECGIYLRDMREINPVPGRFERFEIEGRTVILDYAHTINSLEQTLQLIKELYGREKIVTVFGCGGDRDKTKRKPMGEIALHYSEKVYVTTDNPRGEEPEDIIDDICGDNDRFLIIEDREEAIHQAIKNNPDSVILIAGRGNEEVTYIKGKEYPMKDRDFILNYK